MGIHKLYSLISLLFCPLRELLLSSGLSSRAWQSSLAERLQYSGPDIIQPWNQQIGAPTAAAAMSPPSAVTMAMIHASSQTWLHSAYLSILNYRSCCLHMPLCTPTTAFPTKFLATPVHVSTPNVGKVSPEQPAPVQVEYSAWR